MCPNDIDVLVIGRADADALSAVAEVASSRLGREVNIRQVTPEQWRSADKEDPFLTTVRERAIVSLDLGNAE